ncbi:3-oxoacid CoA-transferase subunit B [Thermomicrobium sp. CFH 73360]|uniref:3-oxoacid CoA-transferase subunit B n=1 Tax=Thermomicrobium sp. CFH 73360 TaxID=2951987 RepID=UPI0020769F42|nr:3-oxoacid CoA-transferase subunit B [Thermomicrobium sp. CFH 73360]MCM8745687.1 3-oxoacid CoA-transferase subunit B [Thermomicrobium sp. CFH 73360]
MPLTREGIAFRIARDLPDGSFVNLGVGIPTLVARFVPPDRTILIHSENGILGAGPKAAPGEEDPDLVNANGDYVTLMPGASLFDHALSFTMIRGGHLTHAVLGALQVSRRGDLANWRIPGPRVPGVGGAMDIAVGAQQVWVATTHTTDQGEPKIVEECTYPLTAARCVRRIYTDLAVLRVEGEHLVLEELAPGVTVEEVLQRTSTRLTVPDGVPTMEVPAEFAGIPLLAS